MKKIKAACFFFSIFFLVLFIFVNCFAGDSINWHEYEEGMELCNNNQEKVFLYFYSDTCRYCKEMENKTFKDSSIIDMINTNFIPVKVNTDKEQGITRNYRVRGLPSVYFLSEDGEIINKYPGFMPSEMLSVASKYVYTDSYKSMSLKSFLDSQKSSEK